MTDISLCENFLDSLHVGDAIEVLTQLPADWISTIVTSPPYYSQREYTSGNDDREIGTEANVDSYVRRLVETFAGCRRVLRNDGSLWICIGDKYEGGRLLGAPWRLALALQDDGWFLRADIIWHKPNAMPSSVSNRPTTDHEYVFLLTKQPSNYYYDADSIREPHVTFTEASRMKGGRGHFGKANGTPEVGKNTGAPNLHRARWDQAFHPLGRNKRTVWSVPLSKSREAHFAVFPESLAKTCILAGSPSGGVVLDPFVGSGTTALVAQRIGRHFVGIDVNPEYVQMTKRRLSACQPGLMAAPEHRVEDEVVQSLGEGSVRSR